MFEHIHDWVGSETHHRVSYYNFNSRGMVHGMIPCYFMSLRACRRAITPVRVLYKCTVRKTQIRAVARIVSCSASPNSSPQRL